MEGTILGGSVVVKEWRT